MSKIEEADANGLFCCQWCPCIFCNETDLLSHLKAFVRKPVPVNVTAINERDHKNFWLEELDKRKHFNFEYE